jgi:trehalose-6-phosphate synthase
VPTSHSSSSPTATQPRGAEANGEDGSRCGSSSGLVTALGPLTDNCRLLWIAGGDTTTPQSAVSRGDGPHALPGTRRVRIRRVPLTPEERHGYYDGFCNEGLWPLCHRTSVRPTFRHHDFQMYSVANARWVTALCEEMTSYQPIVLLDRHADQREVFELFRASDACYVGSLHDGMNLVSKEFVSARDDAKGVLVLSEFAGAARELINALSINPYSSEDCATTLAEALSMPIGEQTPRMRSMRAVVEHSNAYQWAANVLRDAVAVDAGIGARSAFGRRTADTRAGASI